MGRGITQGFMGDAGICARDRYRYCWVVCEIITAQMNLTGLQSEIDLDLDKQKSTEVNLGTCSLKSMVKM